MLQIKIHDNELQGQEEACRPHVMNKSVVCHSVLLAINNSACSNHIESVTHACMANNGGNRHHQSQVPAIVSLMAPVCQPTLEKPSPWHPFTCLLDK